ncbi:MAG: flagellar biosynthesis anti-sigma factor FlgM [Bdellovibrionales bacterium]|nr:flagellar biosynthesis anti-sigma factor FlgM [Bdellovibrionales bacterium]
MSEYRIPEINPRIRKLSHEAFSKMEEQRRTRMEVLKRQLASGEYRPASSALARSLFPNK